MDEYYSENSFDSKTNNYKEYQSQNGTIKYRQQHKESYDNNQKNEMYFNL